MAGKIENRVGFAFVQFQANDEIYSELFRLSDEATIFMAEVVAIRQAVKYIIVRQLKQSKIFSDSRYALMFLAWVHQRRVNINQIKDNLKEYSGDIQYPANLDKGSSWIRRKRTCRSVCKDGLD
ncbi:hypothetical protein AVEN_262510-1 [Araneus ventricosus]|uniref:RNase H type-1 domain-containing protein n=1 Tax=Araneus ventricosus TaxID=182803 RepID=A0A4Y2VNY2_ARAVE|nr:hypothetical protein AVEN_262510-1 [Araneus ventricosus]